MQEKHEDVEYKISVGSININGYGLNGKVFQYITYEWSDGMVKLSGIYEWGYRYHPAPLIKKGETSTIDVIVIEGYENTNEFKEGTPPFHKPRIELPTHEVLMGFNYCDLYNHCKELMTNGNRALNAR